MTIWDVKHGCSTLVKLDMRGTSLSINTRELLQSLSPLHRGLDTLPITVPFKHIDTRLVVQTAWYGAVRSVEEWGALCESIGNHHGEGSRNSAGSVPPAVDFSTHMVLLISVAGVFDDNFWPRPLHRINAIVDLENTIAVRVNMQKIGNTGWMDIVAVPRSEKPVTWFFDAQEDDTAVHRFSLECSKDIEPPSIPGGMAMPVEAARLLSERHPGRLYDLFLKVVVDTGAVKQFGRSMRQLLRNLDDNKITISQLVPLCPVPLPPGVAHDLVREGQFRALPKYEADLAVAKATMGASAPSTSKGRGKATLSSRPPSPSRTSPAVTAMTPEAAAAAVAAMQAGMKDGAPGSARSRSAPSSPLINGAAPLADPPTTLPQLTVPSCTDPSMHVAMAAAAYAAVMAAADNARKAVDAVDGVNPDPAAQSIPSEPSNQPETTASSAQLVPMTPAPTPPSSGSSSPPPTVTDNSAATPSRSDSNTGPSRTGGEQPADSKRWDALTPDGSSSVIKTTVGAPPGVAVMTPRTSPEPVSAPKAKPVPTSHSAPARSSSLANDGEVLAEKGGTRPLSGVPPSPKPRHSMRSAGPLALSSDPVMRGTKRRISVADAGEKQEPQSHTALLTFQGKFFLENQAGNGPSTLISGVGGPTEVADDLKLPISSRADGAAEEQNTAARAGGDSGMNDGARYRALSLSPSKLVGPQPKTSVMGSWKRQRITLRQTELSTVTVIGGGLCDSCGDQPCSCMS